MSNKPSTTQVFKRGQQAAFEGRDKDNPYADDLTLGRVWKKGYEQFLINLNELFDFTERFNYPKAKMSRPHILLKNGNVLRFCFLNAGQFVGYDASDQRQPAEIEDVAAIQYNKYQQYHKWRIQHL